MIDPIKQLTREVLAAAALPSDTFMQEEFLTGEFDDSDRFKRVEAVLRKGTDHLRQEAKRKP